MSQAEALARRLPGSRASLLWLVVLGGFAAFLVLAGGPALVGMIGLALLVLVILVYPIAGLASTLLIYPVYILVSGYVPPGVPVAFLLLALTFLSLAFRRVHEPRPAPFRWSALDAAAAFLLVNGLLYIPLAANLKTGIYGYHEVLKLFLIYFAVRLLAPGGPSIRPLLWVVGFVLAAIALYGCIQPFWNYDYVMVKFGMVESLRDYAGLSGRGLRRAHSILVSPMSLGYVGMMTALCGVAILSVGRRNDAASRLAPFLVAVGIGASALSYTRSSWLGLAAALGAALLVVFRGRGRLLVLLVPLFLGAAAVRFVPDLADRLGHYALTILSRDPTETSFHYVALLDAAKFFWSHLLGTGLGSASFAGIEHGAGIRFWSENTFFLMGIQTGFQGLLALAAFLLAAALAGLSLYRDRAAGRLPRRLGALVFMGTVAFAVAGMSIPTLLDASAFGPLWVLAALVANHRDTPPGWDL